MPLNNPILDAALNNINLETIKGEMGPPPWVRAVVATDHVRAMVICQDAGHENDRHCHDYDEWWIVLEGEINWVIEVRCDVIPVVGNVGGIQSRGKRS